MKSLLGIYYAPLRSSKKKGHAKYTIIDGTGAVCAYGAITAAIFGEPDRDNQISHPSTQAAMRRVVKYLNGGSLTPCADLCNWNNTDSTTAEEVVRVFREAAAVE